MPRTPPERLAAALRANLKRRKAPAGKPVPMSPSGNRPKDPLKPVEKARTPPAGKD